jgi:hypothetical protein
VPACTEKKEYLRWVSEWVIPFLPEIACTYSDVCSVFQNSKNVCIVCMILCNKKNDKLASSSSPASSWMPFEALRPNHLLTATTDQIWPQKTMQHHITDNNDSPTVEHLNPRTHCACHETLLLAP